MLKLIAACILVFSIPLQNKNYMEQ